MAYFLAVLAALLASAVSGTAGFGGAILLLPALTALFGIEKALPLLALAQLVGNAARALLGLAEIEGRSVFYFSLGSIPLTILATLFLLSVPLAQARYFAAAVVLAVVLFESARAFCLLPRFRKASSAPAKAGYWLTVAGALVGIISGLAGTTGPLPNAFFLRLQLTPAAYVATDAAAMGILHATKLAVFGTDIHWSLPVWYLSVSVALAMVAGTWLGRVIIGRIESVRYRRLVVLWMLVVTPTMFLPPVDDSTCKQEIAPRKSGQCRKPW